MKIEAHNSDDAVLTELGRRLANIRLQRNIGQEELAIEAGVSKSTVERLEAGKAVKLPSFVRVLRALDLLGELDRLVPKPLPSPIERLSTQGRRRKRASGGRGGGSQPRGADEPGDWTWSDPSTAGGR